MITNSIIAYGDRLGAQMSTLANLIYIAEENKQQIVFYDEIKGFRRHLQFFDVFDMGDYVKLIQRYENIIPSIYSLQFKKKNGGGGSFKRIYKSKLLGYFDAIYLRFIRLRYRDFHRITTLKGNIHCDLSLLQLDPAKSYDIMSGFGTYRDWSIYEEKIRSLFAFKKEIVEEGNRIFAEYKAPITKDIVGVHFRKTDYLIMSSLNLGREYYKNALQYFNANNCKLLIFSDDIELCKREAVFAGLDIDYATAHSDAIDMYLMTLCDHMIIANSSFSFWGAFLSKNKNHTVICPKNFIGENDIEHSYINGNWYPTTWIAI